MQHARRCSQWGTAEKTHGVCVNSKIGQYGNVPLGGAKPKLDFREGSDLSVCAPQGLPRAVARPAAIMTGV